MVTVLVVKEWESLEPKSWNVEIKDKQFFEQGELPENTSPATKKRIREYLSGRANCSGDW